MLDDKLNLILSFLNMVSWKTKSSVILIWLDDKINLISSYLILKWLSDNCMYSKFNSIWLVDKPNLNSWSSFLSDLNRVRLQSKFYLFLSYHNMDRWQTAVFVHMCSLSKTTVKWDPRQTLAHEKWQMKAIWRPHVLCVSPTALLDTMCCDVI